MPTALGSHLLGVGEGMEPQEQGGVALSLASAMPEALPSTIREGGRERQHARAQESSWPQSLGRPQCFNTLKEAAEG